MADQEKINPQTEGTPPPRQMPFKTLQPTANAAADDASEKPTIALKKQPELRRPGEAAPSADAAVTDAIKRKTTRIELPAAAVDNDDGEFKTVKLRPIQPPQPGSAPLPPGPKPPTAAQAQAAKSKTSRISLEAAFGEGAPDMAASSGPKTIRLKRPSELAKGATAELPSLRQTGPTPIVTPLQTSQTAKLPTQQLDNITPPTDDDANSPTRRKTIKIKRPATAGGIKVAVAGGDDDADSDSDSTLPTLTIGAKPVATGPDSAHWSFIVAAAAAVIVTLIVVWVLAAQTFGPNAAVTGYSSLAGPHIPPPPGVMSLN